MIFLYIVGCNIYSVMTWSRENSCHSCHDVCKDITIYRCSSGRLSLFLPYFWSCMCPGIWAKSNRNCSSVDPLQPALFILSSFVFFPPCFPLVPCGYNLPLDSVLEQILIFCLPFSLARSPHEVADSRRIGTWWLQECRWLISIYDVMLRI